MPPNQQLKEIKIVNLAGGAALAGVKRKEAAKSNNLAGI
jgi:hypothetical protein